MRRLQKVICFFVGHKTSLFKNIGAPMAFRWAYPAPGESTPVQQIPPPTVVTQGVQGTGSGGGVTHFQPVPNSPFNLFQGPPTKQGPTFQLDLCQRCLALYVNEPPPMCANCDSVKEMHVDDFCARPCQNCGKGREAHLDNKCLFDSSEFKGTKWVKSTNFGCR